MIVGSFVRAVGVVALLAIPVVHGSATALHAGALTEQAAQIEALIEQGRAQDAVVAARGLLRSVTTMTGFGVTNARLVDGPASGFGMFEPRQGNRYAPGDPVYAYVEIYGFSLTEQASGANQLLFDVDFTLDSLDGRQMTDSMIDMGEVRIESYSAPIDGFFHLTYRVTGAEGAFNLRTHVTDRASGQSGEFVLPVVFDPAVADPAHK